MRFILIFGLIFSLHSAQATVSGAYIKDLEGLLNSVDNRDSSRPQLTLKLADALYNEALGLSGQPTLSESEKKRLAADRRRSVQLYQDSLTGLKGTFSAPSGTAKGKIQFQLARLYNDLGQASLAEAIWKDLSSQDDMADIQRESLLRLAEVLENRASKDDLKKAEAYYKKAITLCSTQDVCSYSHYRLAWVYNRQEKSAPAIAEMDLALWDSKGQIREEALRDLVGFLGSTGDDGKQNLEKIEKLSAKLKRPQLLSDLSDSYFAHGNRKAGVLVLDEVNRKAPSLKGYVRLLEEDYGFRDWTKFESGLDSAAELATKVTPQDAETEKVLRRLTVQLDGERGTNPAASDAFKRTVMLYMTLYPNRAERGQMIDGWLAAEKDDAVKSKQLATWISEEHAAGRAKEEQRLRKTRAAVAQKAGDYATVAAEMTALQGFTGSASEKRESSYQLAYALYLNKDYDAALPRFKELAAVASGAPDKWAIQSQNLALDILGKRKDYSAVMAQAHTWTANPEYAAWVKNEKQHKNELSDVQKVEQSARFEWATAQGSTAEALAIYNEDCAQNLFLPKSCANAQVLAVKLGDQKTLIGILKKTGKNDELAGELEASAEFTEAAQMLEKKLNAKSSSQDYLKVALLFELGSQKVNRDRVLHAMIATLGKKPLGEEEPLILQTLKDADMINVATLKLGWKKENREYLTDLLVREGKGTAEMQNELVRSCHDTGSAWRKVALTELRKLDDKQKAIHFSGKGSKRKFEVRVAALKGLSERANCYMQSTTASERVIIATLLARSELGLAEEIKASPIPEGVDEEGKVSLQKALAELAQPFLDKGEEFQKLAQAQLEKVDPPSEKQSLSDRVQKNDESLFAVEPVDTAPHAALATKEKPSQDILNSAIQDLHRNPNQKNSLVQLKAYYEADGNPRLAAYFQGRLKQLGEETKQ